jgi:hypothetical protein
VRNISNGKFLEVPRISGCGNPQAFHGSGCRAAAQNQFPEFPVFFAKTQVM